MKIGVLPLGRPTFDVDYAKKILAEMLRCLDAAGHELVGSRDLLLDESATRRSLDTLNKSEIDLLLVLQVTFTDAAMVVEAARLGKALAIWAVPEPRNGGRCFGGN